MATGGSHTLAVSCPACGAKFRLGIELAEKRGRCAKCGEVFRVPKSTHAVAPTRAEAVPQYIGLACRVCQTRMYGRSDQVGQSIKCPDCGAQTIVPRPEPVKQTKRPAAFDGEQYELWGVDEAPSVAEMLAAQPKYIAVMCIRCQTLMHATEDQVGTKLQCPDCRTENLVPPPDMPPPPPLTLSREMDELTIDATLDPGERPLMVVPPRRPMLYEQEKEAEEARQAEKAARGDKRGPQFDVRGRAIMPRWPLLSGIVPFLFSSGVLVRWITLSAGLLVSGGLVLLGMWLAAMGGFGAIGGMSFFAMGMIVLAIWLAGASAIFIAVVTESSEGNDQIQNWPPPILTEWVGELMVVLVAGLVSPLPGWLVGQFVFGDPTQQVLWFVGSVLVFFPIILLSQLDTGSPFGVASPRVVASLVRVPFSWILFYAELAAIAVVCGVVTILLGMFVPVLGVLLFPLVVAALFLAARLLGRLGWKLAESMPVTA